MELLSTLGFFDKTTKFLLSQLIVSCFCIKKTKPVDKSSTSCHSATGKPAQRVLVRPVSVLALK